jgi:hypothetical protein
MASARKPAIVRKLSRDWVAGYVPADPVQDGSELEMLDPSGKIIHFNLDQIKWICYLRELGTAANDPANPERLIQKRFRTRPRSIGIWVRITFADNDLLEGIVANDASLIQGSGLMLTPPDTRANTQRIFVPRQAIEAFEVVGLIGTSERRRTRNPIPEDQASLFPAEMEGPSVESGN